MTKLSQFQAFFTESPHYEDDMQHYGMESAVVLPFRRKDLEALLHGRSIALVVNEGVALVLCPSILNEDVDLIDVQDRRGNQS
jgi:hypothetical protein